MVGDRFACESDFVPRLSTRALVGCISVLLPGAVLRLAPLAEARIGTRPDLEVNGVAEGKIQRRLSQVLLRQDVLSNRASDPGWDLHVVSSNISDSDLVLADFSAERLGTEPLESDVAAAGVHRGGCLDLSGGCDASFDHRARFGPETASLHWQVGRLCDWTWICTAAGSGHRVLSPLL